MIHAGRNRRLGRLGVAGLLGRWAAVLHPCLFGKRFHDSDRRSWLQAVGPAAAPGLAVACANAPGMRRRTRELVRELGPGASRGELKRLANATPQSHFEDSMTRRNEPPPKRSRNFLTGDTVSLPSRHSSAGREIAIVIHEPTCPSDLVAVVETWEGGSATPVWVRPDDLLLCTCCIPDTEHEPCETHGSTN
jgi:hypothetical protein